MRHLVIANPRAGRRDPGTGRSREVRALLEPPLRAAGLDVEIVSTRGPRDASALLERRGREFEGVIVAGGDGTLHEVLQALDLDRHRLGLLPLGTGNDFAWDEGWTADLARCARRIASGPETRLDVGTWRAETPGGVRAGRFHNSVGLGFEATVNERSHRVARVKGPALYVAALLLALPRYRSYRVRVTGDGGEFHEGPVSFLAAGNGKRVGGAFLTFPGADRRDGLLDLVLAEAMPLPRALRLALRLRAGTHAASPRVRTARAARWRFEAPAVPAAGAGMPAYVDGEFIDRRVASLEVRVLPGALRSYGLPGPD